MKERKSNLNGRVVFTVILLLVIAAFILFAIFSRAARRLTAGRCASTTCSPGSRCPSAI